MLMMMAMYIQAILKNARLQITADNTSYEFWHLKLGLHSVGWFLQVAKHQPLQLPELLNSSSS